MFIASYLRIFWLGAFGLVWLGMVGGADAEEGGGAFGPLYQQFKLTLTPGERTEVAGPLFSWEETGEPGDVTRTWALPPLLSHGVNDGTDYEFYDFLWKIITYDRFGSEYRLQLLQLFSFSGGGTQSDTNVHRVTLFPLYFQQRSQIPEKNYTALVPIYGHLQGRLFKDEAKFILFPLYGQTRKRDVVTDNFVYPFFHLRHGDGLHGWQFWPLYGTEHKEITYRTNHWGGVERGGGHDKLFALWPIFHDLRTGLGTENPAHEQALLPFYSFLRSPRRDTTAFPWPLGYTRTVDREKGYRETGAPWPFIVFARGAGRRVDRVWPFYNVAANATHSSESYLWPLYKHTRLNSPPLDRERTRLLYFLYSDISVKNLETRQSERRIYCWPFFTMKRSFDDRRRLQVLALLEPFLPNDSGVERNLSPLWSLWRSEANPQTGAASQSLLWNLYRRETAPLSKKCSLLFGLFQYQSAPEGRRWRVCYLPFERAGGKPRINTNEHE